jgi:hypothetical protein
LLNRQEQRSKFDPAPGQTAVGVAKMINTPTGAEYYRGSAKNRISSSKGVRNKNLDRNYINVLSSSSPPPTSPSPAIAPSPSPVSTPIQPPTQPPSFQLPSTSGDLPLPVDNYLNALNMDRIGNYGKGHCILLSVHHCLKYVPGLEHVSFGGLVSRLLSYVNSWKDYYQAFCSHTPDICKAIIDYLQNRRHTTEVVDLVPNILAEALHIGINILAPTSTGSHLVKVLPVSPEVQIPEIVLLRSDSRGDEGTHYTSAVPRTLILPAVSQSPTQEADHRRAVEEVLAAAETHVAHSPAPPCIPASISQVL